MAWAGLSLTAACMTYLSWSSTAGILEWTLQETVNANVKASPSIDGTIVFDLGFCTKVMHVQVEELCVAVTVMLPSCSVALDVQPKWGEHQGEDLLSIFDPDSTKPLLVYMF